MNITLTDSEKQVLEGINNSDYGDQLGDPIWSWSINCKITGKERSGVCGSLAKKGLVNGGDSGKDSTINLTQLGIDICKEHNLLGKYSE